MLTANGNTHRSSSIEEFPSRKPSQSGLSLTNLKSNNHKNTMLHLSLNSEVVNSQKERLLFRKPLHFDTRSTYMKKKKKFDHPTTERINQNKKSCYKPSRFSVLPSGSGVLTSVQSLSNFDNSKTGNLLNVIDASENTVNSISYEIENNSMESSEYSEMLFNGYESENNVLNTKNNKNNEDSSNNLKILKLIAKPNRDISEQRELNIDDMLDIVEFKKKNPQGSAKLFLYAKDVRGIQSISNKCLETATKVLSKSIFLSKNNLDQQSGQNNSDISYRNTKFPWLTTYELDLINKISRYCSNTLQSNLFFYTLSSNVTIKNNKKRRESHSLSCTKSIFELLNSDKAYNEIYQNLIPLIQLSKTCIEDRKPKYLIDSYKNSGISCFALPGDKEVDINSQTLIDSFVNKLLDKKPFVELDALIPSELKSRIIWKS